ncbi:MAG: L,D-transpeptidase family protein, partial [Pseudomonadota bacterium]|nr:L,D-transpeptidase family protein [Pseudomonadota bacterium]
MNGLRYGILASTALALVLAASGPAPASPGTIEAVIDAGIPLPESANLPPLSLSDIEPSAAKLAPAATNAAPVDTTGTVAQPDNPKKLDETAAPAANTAAPADTTATIAQPDSPKQLDAVAIKALTGKDLVKGPIATAIPAEDYPVAEKLRDLLATKLGRYVDRKNERVDVEVFYRDRGFAPLWSSKSAPTAHATGAIAYLRGVDAEGLDPADYPTPDFTAARDADALAEAELKLTAAVLTFARHAQNGRVHWSRVSGAIAYSHDAVDPAENLAKLAEAKTIGEALASFNPQHAGYQALKAKLAEAYGQKPDAPVVRIPSGPVLKLGKDRRGKEIVMTDARVPLLRERLGLPASADNTSYDKPLADAVAKFQRQRELSPNGQLNAATLAALNGQRRDRDADIIIANMERWRWLPRDLGNTHVMVNIPDYTLRVMRDGALYWKTNIVVGKPGDLATPITTAMMKFITVNPTWNVPPSIVANEYLPALRQDPTVLDRMGLKITQNPDGTVHIYQPPGDKNALGRIRFNFPNKFLVYQHDTPDKHLFAHDKRAYSHGCMRVQDPIKYGEVLLSLVLPKQNYTQERLRKMFGPGEINIDFPVHIPVHLTYQTAYVDDAGKLAIREDVYGRDSALLAQLKGDSRRVADLSIERGSGNSGVTRDALRYRVREENFFSGWFRPDERRSGPPAEIRQSRRYYR